MKRQIRSSVFETNSSSTHSIAIPKDANKPDYINFHIGEFGWAFEEVSPADYFYTAIYETSNTEEEVNDKIAKLEEILTSHGIEYYLGPVEAHTWHSNYDNMDYYCLDNGYIDHGAELNSFVNELLDDKEKLIRFLGEGIVFTGNDNADVEELCFVNRCDAYLEDYDWKTRMSFDVENPYYMRDHEDYEWYYKGN